MFPFSFYESISYWAVSEFFISFPTSNRYLMRCRDSRSWLSFELGENTNDICKFGSILQTQSPQSQRFRYFNLIECHLTNLDSAAVLPYRRVPKFCPVGEARSTRFLPVRVIGYLKLNGTANERVHMTRKIWFVWSEDIGNRREPVQTRSWEHKFNHWSGPANDREHRH
jgi:hypothetical protein